MTTALNGMVSNLLAHRTQILKFLSVPLLSKVEVLVHLPRQLRKNNHMTETWITQCKSCEIRRAKRMPDCFFHCI